MRLLDVFSSLEKYTNQIDTDLKYRRSSREYIYNLHMNLNSSDTNSFIEYMKNSNNENITTTVNYYDIHDLQKSDINEINKITITAQQSLVDNKNEFYFLFEKDYIEYLKYFFENIKILDLQDIEHKFKYNIYYDKDIKFTDCDSNIFSQKKNEPLEIYSILMDEKLYNNHSIVGVVDAVPNVYKLNNQEAVISGVLGILADRIIENNSEREYVISLDKLTYLKTSDIDCKLEVIEVFSEIQNFIFNSSEKYYDKLSVFRNLFVEKAQSNLIDQKMLTKILEDTKIHYQLFINDKIKKFVDQKQKVIEDSLKFNENIVKSINSTTEELPKQLLTTIGIIISTFFIKSINQSNLLWVIPLLALIYFATYFILKSYRGWYFESESLKKQIALSDSSYEKLYTLDKEFLNKTRNDYIEPKLNQLVALEKKVKCISILMLLIFIIWLLIA